VQVRAFLLAERGEEVILDLLRERSQPPQHPLAIAGEADEVSAAVVRIATALDQPALLELVEESDQLAPVVAQRVGDRALRLSRAFVQDEQDRVMVRVEAGALVRLHRALLDRKAQPLQQERA